MAHTPRPAAPPARQSPRAGGRRCARSSAAAWRRPPPVAAPPAPRAGPGAMPSRPPSSARPIYSTRRRGRRRRRDQGRAGPRWVSASFGGRPGPSWRGTFTPNSRMSRRRNCPSGWATGSAVLRCGAGGLGLLLRGPKNGKVALGAFFVDAELLHHLADMAHLNLGAPLLLPVFAFGEP